MPYPRQAEQIAVSKWNAFKLLPRWVWYLLAAAALAVVVYLSWLKWGPQPAKPGSVVISAPQAPAIAKMETRTVYVPRLVVVKDKAAAVTALKLPAAEATNPKEELLTATAMAANRHGATTAVFINTSTGKARTDIIYKPSPWFSFERTNYAGGSIGYSSIDKTVERVYYKRDLASIKGVYIQGELEGIARPSAPQGRVGEVIVWGNAEYRW